MKIYMITLKFQASTFRFV